MLPDYLIGPDSELVAVLPDYEVPSFDCFFVYPEELRDSARVTVFRDFLIANARRWSY
jgi:DNA-binding transcriptional LysR family regulator